MSNIIKKFDDFQQMNEEVFSTLTSSLGKLIGKGKNVISGKSNKAFKVKTDDESMGKKILTSARGVSANPNTSDTYDRVHNPANNWYYFFAKIDGNIYKVDAVNHLANAGSSENEYTISILKYSKNETPEEPGEKGGPEKPIKPEEPENGGEIKAPDSPEKEKNGGETNEPKKTDDGSIYPIMIKNLTALRDLLKNYVYIKIGEETVKFDKESYEEKKDVAKKEKPELPENNENKMTLYIDKILRIVSKEVVPAKEIEILNKNMMLLADDEESNLSRELIEKITELRKKIKKIQALIDNESTYENERKSAIKSKEVLLNRIKNLINSIRSTKLISASNESLYLNYIDDYLSFCLNEKNRFTKGNKSTIHNNEDYLKQSFIKIQKSIKILEDSKDKGVSINADFIDEILKEKMTHKEDIKKLFDEIYEHLYGKYSVTMAEIDKLYKENVSVMVKNQKVVAEKMARFAKRSVQFEGEGLYSGLAVFGDNLETYNQTLIQIMKYVENKKKNTPKNESILLESRYKGVKLNLSKQLAKTIFKELEKKYKLMNPKY